jgi:hypothetical protein
MTDRLTTGCSPWLSSSKGASLAGIGFEAIDEVHSTNWGVLSTRLAALAFQADVSVYMLGRIRVCRRKWDSNLYSGGWR